MRRLILAALGVFAVAGVASAQQPQPVPVQAPVYAPAAVASTPVIQGSGGCSNCGSSGIRGAFHQASGGNCTLAGSCQNGCGSLKSDLAFHFGSCKGFFNPCGPTCGGGLGGKCGFLPFAQPWGPGWSCPRQYDTYLNH
jgi:hypothetical protein